MTTSKLQHAAAPADRPAIIARRGACEADGVGLSHYILLDPAAPVRPAESAPAGAPVVAPAA